MQGQFQEGQVDQFYPIDAIGRWKLLAGRKYKVSPLFQNMSVVLCFAPYSSVIALLPGE